MDIPQANHNQKQQPKRKLQSPNNNKHTPCKRLTQDQVRLLERSFVHNKRLDPERKLQLAAELDIPPRQVAIWYQNRRARWKTQTLELDHSALQLKLDSALEEKERLLKDVEVLQGELRRAQDLILLLNNGAENNNDPSCSSSSSLFSMVLNLDNNRGTSPMDRGGNRSSDKYQYELNCCWDDDAAEMRVDDLYAWFELSNGIKHGLGTK